MSIFLRNIIKRLEPKNKKKFYSKLTKYTWYTFLGGTLLLIIFIFTVTINLFNLYGEFPSYEALENPEEENNLASELYSADGELLGKYFRENRSQVDYDELSPDLVNALISTEDVRFRKHSGIDLVGVIRAIIGKLTFNFAGGGSTITQQLSENIFFNRSEHYKGLLHEIPGLSIYIDKFKEWIVSVQLERDYTKEEILSMYLNTVDFGSNSFGIKVAAKTFFNKIPAELNVQESAMLVGLLQAPTRYSPVLNYDNSVHRRNVVLGQMMKYDFISENTFDSLKTQPIELEYKVEGHNEGLATYFRSVIGDFLRSWSEEHGFDLYSDGLKIYTTIDSRMQKHAEASVDTQMEKLQNRFNEHWGDRNPWIYENGREIKGFIESKAKVTPYYRNLVRKYSRDSDSVDYYMNKKRKTRVFTWKGSIDTLLSPIDSIKYYKKFLQTGFMAMDPHTGDIKAWVGGINHTYFKYDHVMQSRRQPGSTFKPIVYTAAIDNYFSPCYPVVDAPVTFSMPGQNPPTWTPSNADGKYTGRTFTLRQAMARSINSATAFIMKKIGPQTVVEYAKKLGINGNNIQAVPSLALGGGGEVSVYEMVGAYATFVNQGTYIEPRYITRIEDKNGNIWTIPTKTREALSKETAFLMLHMLMGTTQEAGGTALGLDYELRHSMEIGAKTGTTQNGSDGWFMGITKDLAAGAWVGGDDRSIRFRSWYEGQGARTAMPIWEDFMKRVYNDEDLNYEGGSFSRPAQGLSVQINCAKYDTRSVLDKSANDRNNSDVDVREEDIF
jgi:penicillin-binding protein 1A